MSEEEKNLEEKIETFSQENRSGLSDLVSAYFLFQNDLKKQDPEKARELDYLIDVAIKMQRENNQTIQDVFLSPLLNQIQTYFETATLLKTWREKKNKKEDMPPDIEKLARAPKKARPADLVEPLFKTLYEKYGISRPVKTFAIPSHPIMFTLLALFSGKPHKIPGRLLEKPHEELTDLEKKKIEEYQRDLKEEIFKPGYTLDGAPLEENKTKIIIPIDDRAKVAGQLLLFKEDVFFQEDTLALYIKKTFGVEGLRHLLGLLVGLDENFRRGYFEWEVNEHLDRLGYKKHTGAYTQAQKLASKIIQLFTSIAITAAQKIGERTKIEGMRLFSIDGFKEEIFKNEVIEEKLLLRATEPWYRYAFEPQDGSSPKYTELLKRVVTEWHVNHPLTIYLAPLLAVFWRMNQEQKLSIENLMGWCNLDFAGHKRTDYLKDLEAELNYMVEKDYLGKWENLGYRDKDGYMRLEDPLPSKCKEPFSCVLKLIAPNWLQTKIKQIRSRRERLLTRAPGYPKEDILSMEEFNRILENSGRTQKQFANSIGVSRQMVAAIKAGTKRASLKISRKTREVFGNLL